MKRGDGTLRRAVVVLMSVVGVMVLVAAAMSGPSRVDDGVSLDAHTPVIPTQRPIEPVKPRELSVTESPAPSATEAILKEEPIEEPIVSTEAPLVTSPPVITTIESFGSSRFRGYPLTGEAAEVPEEYPVDPGECIWETTFSDDFSGSELDLEKWNPEYKAGDKEWQHYVPDALELDDGLLIIRAEEREVRGRDFASGIITTQGLFDQQYGFFELRARVPNGQGLWPAFWLLPSQENYPLEIDVFEILGHETDVVYMTNHWRDPSGEHVFDTQGLEGPDFSEAFHTFAIHWTAEEITWYVDGVEAARELEGIPHEPMFMLINLAVGGEWPGYPDETTPFPSEMEVDYVRVAQMVCSGAGSEGEME